ncbi:excinuclease ABC subunit UvrA [candidate division KSB3 bacterium]|uniref:UvrABC system protein A n=1 Tax=candidate division KSB3 bacterium TaxID=2044937 RepID=A0A9D5JS73_9BACT|nr:excinuclease ABC subunit UvrA [candidate division KSB3 bacterium]MBD3323155.1 excinuclease ABC subunit UvrA [candidate division KSB3 bacterium]
MKSSQSIRIHGANVHNLKNIDVEIPYNQLVVITGVSGSGKSSLAFDTLYAEGQRRYVESLSAYARQFLERMDKPDVQSIEGICPAIAIEQKNRVRNARSTIGTTTEIYDYLRLLFARIGNTYCERCQGLVQNDSIDHILEHLFRLEPGTRFLVTFPLEEKYALEHLEWQVKDHALELERLKELLISKGFLRVLINGGIIYLEDEAFHFTDEHDVFVIVDRLALKEEIRQRLADALETAYQEGNGRLAIWTMDALPPLHAAPETSGKAAEQPTHLHRFSRKFECARCGITYKEPEPRMFSFNNPYGACPVCHGFGDTISLDMDLIIPDWQKSIRDGAIVPWTTPKSAGIIRRLAKIAPKYGFTIDTPLEALTPAQREMLIEGNHEFIGIKPFFDYLEEKKYKMHIRVFLSKYRRYTSCPACQGSRLNPAAELVRVGGLTIDAIARMTIAEAQAFFETLRLSDFELTIVSKVIEELRNRLHYLVDVGLDYLTINRLSRTLSGGEAQRIHLATSLGTSLVSSLYVLDEPSIGLHPRDNARLISILKALRDTGNTVVVVEHDAEMIRQSDYVIDMGPNAGEHGGEVIFAGPIARLLRNGQASLTGQYLRQEKAIPLPSSRRSPSGTFLTLEGASEHNLKQLDVSIPLGLFVCITGVSGSGKSTLVEDVLYKALQGERREGNGYRRLRGREHLTDVVLVDQSPIGRTPRSNPITYMKAFDEIRKLFASMRLSKERGYKPGTFSFNIAGGRCEVCQGNGQIQVEMQFLADLYLTCEACRGTRYKPEVLDVKYQNRSIHDVLTMTVDEAVHFFLDQRKIVRKLKPLQAVGLGYLRLGQPATTLSGGEAQRLKLAAHLADRRKKRILYLFDEPTTGLHFDDISKLLECFTQLLNRGHSVIVIEHNLEVMKCADYLIDLGPEGGDQGGEVIACGTPEALCHHPHSHTGTYLQAYLQADETSPKGLT